MCICSVPAFFRGSVITYHWVPFCVPETACYAAADVGTSRTGPITVTAKARLGRGTEAKLALDKAGRYAAHDIVCEEHNFLESEVTPLKP